MKKQIIGLSMALFMVATANAQDRPTRTPEDRAKMRTERMTKELGLNADQQAKVAAINMDYAKKGAELRDDHANGTAEKGEGAKLQDARMAELKQVLTPEQYTKLEAMQAKAKDRMKKHRAEKKAAPVK